MFINPTIAYYSQDCITTAAQALRDDWRLLWEQHVAWTRMTILSAAFGLPDLPQVSARLLQNPDAMGAVMRQFYGDAAAAKFAALIREHLEIAIRLVGAAKAGDAAAAAQIEKQWYANADEIARFLAGLNPYWPQEAFRAMLHEHLRLTKEEATAILTGKYQQSIALYDQIERQALMMADALTGGILKQFPQMFR